jgi:hypothetical protein
MNSSPPIAIHCLVRFPASFLGFFVLAAVPRFLALCQSDFDLGDALAKINPQRDNSQTFCVGFSRPFMNFAFVQEKFAVAKRFMVPRTSGKILRNVSIHEIGATGLEIDESIANVGFAFTQGLDFGTMKDKSRFHFFENVIIIRSGTILSDNLICCRFRVLRPLWTLLRSLIWLCHNLSFYLMARLSERTGNATLPGNTQPPGRNPSQGEDRMTGSRAGSLIEKILTMITFRRAMCGRRDGLSDCGKRREPVPQWLKPIESQVFNVGAKAPTQGAKRFLRKVFGETRVSRGEAKPAPLAPKVAAPVEGARKRNSRPTREVDLWGTRLYRLTGNWAGGVTGTQDSMELEAC